MVEYTLEFVGSKVNIKMLSSVEFACQRGHVIDGEVSNNYCVIKMSSSL